MNTLHASITHIEEMAPLHVLRFAVGRQSMTMLSLQIDTTLQIGSHVSLSVKSTDIMLAKRLDAPLSTANCLQASVVRVRNGALLSTVTLNMEGMALQSIITRHASQQLALRAADVVIVVIKESDVSLC